MAESETDEMEKTATVLPKVKVSTLRSILIESLVKNLCSVYESNGEKQSAMYETVCRHLFEMNMIDESYRMEEFEGVRTEYQKAFHRLLKTSLGDGRLTKCAIPNDDFTISHYRREFDELEYVAGGGFGVVYKVRHKLDGTEYAVKKIPIRSEGIDAVSAYLSEVKTFASLNHPNIVQYKAAWLESGATPLHEDPQDYEASSCKIKEHIDDEYIYHRSILDSFSTSSEHTSDFEVDFEHSVPCERSKQKRTKRDSVSDGDLAIATFDAREVNEWRVQRHPPIQWATLYIQMALCPSTLKQWLEKRNSAEIGDKALISVNGQMRNETIYEVLKQLLRGLEYIHSKGIVHHDIKPSNIFIQLDNGKLLVQLGDFGLACPLQSVRHSLAFGTKLYAAPEQLAGKCDSKSDMYSLGIVLFELVETFRTDMERVRSISELRKGRLPQGLVTIQPQFSQIIGNLVTNAPAMRPSAAELLEMLECDAPEHRLIADLIYQIDEKDREIGRLKALLDSAGIET